MVFKPYQWNPDSTNLLVRETCASRVNSQIQTKSNKKISGLYNHFRIDVDTVDSPYSLLPHKRMARLCERFPLFITSYIIKLSRFGGIQHVLQRTVSEYKRYVSCINYHLYYLHQPYQAELLPHQPPKLNFLKIEQTRGISKSYC